MTDITDQDRRAAREWANWASTYADRSMAKAAARVILATVDAPAPTLAEELRDIASQAANIPYMADGDAVDQEAERIGSALTAAASRVEQIEQERDEARAEVERLTAERQEETMRCMDEQYTDLPVHDRDWTRTDGTPDPADVPEGQAWAVSIDDMEETAGFKASGFGWICYRELGGTTKAIPSDRITLVSRLVPAPRQITTREILDEAPRRTVIRDKDGVVCERASLGDGWYSPESTTDQTDYIKYPATVLWTPEVPA